MSQRTERDEHEIEMIASGVARGVCTAALVLVVAYFFLTSVGHLIELALGPEAKPAFALAGVIVVWAIVVRRSQGRA